MSERKEKFTPGPWKYDTKSSMIDAETGETIGEIFDYDDLKNGLLAAAAPEMLEHGDEVTAFLAYLLSRDMLPYPYNKAAHSKIEKWKELSKKARGEE